ncbi:MAG: SpoIIE family protein phosphatase [Pontiellaceae bacterium]
MLTSLNNILSDNLAEDMFISMLYMVLNTETHLLSFARAGHEAPIILHRDNQKIDRDESDGIAIGLVDSSTFKSIIENKKYSIKIR